MLWSGKCNDDPNYTQESMAAGGTPVYRNTLSCLKAVRAAMRYGEFLRHRKLRAAQAARPARVDVDAARWQLHATRGTLTERASKQVLAAYGFPVTRETLARDAGEAVRIAREARELQELWQRSPRESRWADGFVRPVPNPANSRFGTRSIYNGQPPANASGISDPAGARRAPNAAQVVLARDLCVSGPHRRARPARAVLDPGPLVSHRRASGERRRRADCQPRRRHWPRHRPASPLSRTSQARRSIRSRWWSCSISAAAPYNPSRTISPLGTHAATQVCQSDKSSTIFSLWPQGGKCQTSRRRTGTSLVWTRATAPPNRGKRCPNHAVIATGAPRITGFGPNTCPRQGGVTQTAIARPSVRIFDRSQLPRLLRTRSSTPCRSDPKRLRVRAGPIGCRNEAGTSIARAAGAELSTDADRGRLIVVVSLTVWRFAASLSAAHGVGAAVGLTIDTRPVPSEVLIDGEPRG
jgi:hypothetical protein